ncbi:MAG: hypothetical protein U0610_04970 [bacterium]
MSARKEREARLAVHAADAGVERREFLTSLGRIVVLFPPSRWRRGAAAAAAGANDGGGGNTNGFAITSSTASGHSHDLFVPFDAVEQPASAPVALVTGASSTYTLGSHTHTVTLSVDSLTSIMHGGTVTVSSASTAGHVHEFAIHLP